MSMLKNTLIKPIMPAPFNFGFYIRLLKISSLNSKAGNRFSLCLKELTSLLL